MRKCWWGRFPLEGSGTWSYMVRSGKGALALDLRAQQTLHFRKGSAFRFWSCSIPLVSLGVGEGESLVPGVVWDKRFLLYACFACMAHGLFCFLWKTTQYLVRNRTGPVWGWFCSYIYNIKCSPFNKYPIFSLHKIPVAAGTKSIPHNYLYCTLLKQKSYFSFCLW